MESIFNRMVALTALCLVPVFLALPAEKASASIIIAEIMQNPSAVSDSNGEWFEVYNSGLTSVDLNGWTIEDNDSDSHIINNGGALSITAGGFLVFGRNGDSGTNGGVILDYVYSSIALANGADELVLLDSTLTEMDRVEWDGGPGFPGPAGASMALLNPGFDNNVGTSWIASSATFGSGDRGTPGAANNSSFIVSVSEPSAFLLIISGLASIRLFRRER